MRLADVPPFAPPFRGWAGLVLVGFVLGAACPGPVVAQTLDVPLADSLAFGGRETLRLPPLPDWVETHRGESGGAMVRHLVPEDQAGGPDWRDMITVQVLKTPHPPALASLHARARSTYEESCENVLGGALQRGETNGLETGFWTLGCALNTATGQGETAFFKAVRGLEGVYLVQRVWRVPPFDVATGPGIAPRGQQAAIALLKDAVVCIPESHAHPCP